MDVVTQVKYLGLDLVCNRQQMLKLAKNRCKKYLAYVKRKI